MKANVLEPVHQLQKSTNSVTIENHNADNPSPKEATRNERIAAIKQSVATVTCLKHSRAKIDPVTTQFRGSLGYFELVVKMGKMKKAGAINTRETILNCVTFKSGKIRFYKHRQGPLAVEIRPNGSVRKLRVTAVGNVTEEDFFAHMLDALIAYLNKASEAEKELESSEQQLAREGSGGNFPNATTTGAFMGGCVALMQMHRHDMNAMLMAVCRLMGCKEVFHDTEAATKSCNTNAKQSLANRIQMAEEMKTFHAFLVDLLMRGVPLKGEENGVVVINGRNVLIQFGAFGERDRFTGEANTIGAGYVIESGRIFHDKKKISWSKLGMDVRVLVNGVWWTLRVYVDTNDDHVTSFVAAAAEYKAQYDPQPPTATTPLRQFQQPPQPPQPQPLQYAADASGHEDELLSWPLPSECTYNEEPRPTSSPVQHTTDSPASYVEQHSPTKTNSVMFPPTANCHHPFLLHQHQPSQQPIPPLATFATTTAGTAVPLQQQYQQQMQYQQHGNFVMFVVPVEQAQQFVNFQSSIANDQSFVCNGSVDVISEGKKRKATAPKKTVGGKKRKTNAERSGNVINLVTEIPPPPPSNFEELLEVDEREVDERESLLMDFDDYVPSLF